MATWRSLGMLIFLVLVTLSIGQLGDYFTTAESFIWYHQLIKPSWTPPDFIFPIVWTSLYTLMAVAAWLVWRGKKPGYRNALIFWSVQLVINAIWTPLFFGQQDIVYGLVVIDILWIFLLITMVMFFRRSFWAGLFMFLYFVWISFAAVLNFLLLQMNR